MGVSRPKSTLQESGLDKIARFEIAERSVESQPNRLWRFGAKFGAKFGMQIRGSKIRETFVLQLFWPTSLLKGSFDKCVRIDSPVPLPIPTSPPTLPTAFPPKPLAQAWLIWTRTPMRKLPPVRTTKSWFSGKGMSPAVHWVARTSSLDCLSCRKPYQTPHSLNCLPPFWLKKPFCSTEKCFVASPSPKSAQNYPLVSDAAFLLTVGSFLLTVELFYLQVTILAFLLTVGAFLLTSLASLLTAGAFLLTVGKCI